MPVRVVRKDLSTLGFCLILSILLGNIVTIVMMAVPAVFIVCRMMLTSGTMPGTEMIPEITASVQNNALFILITNCVSVYLVGLGSIFLWMRKRIPTVRAERTSEDAGTPDFTWKDFLVIIPIIVFLMDIGAVIGAGIARFTADQIGIEANDRLVEMLLSGELWQTILFVVIIGPIAEELFYRKFLIDSFSGYSKRGAILLSALTFGIFHQNFFQMFYTAFVGMILAWVYVKTGKIRYPILIHMGVNFFGGIVMPACLQGLMDCRESLIPVGRTAFISKLVREHPETVWFIAIYGALSLTGLILFLIWLKKKRFRVTEEAGAMRFFDFAEAYATAPGQIAYLITCVILAGYVLFVSSL